MRLVHADALIPGDGAPIRDAAVVLDQGTIVDVGPAGEVIPRHAGLPVEKERLVFPGLVNVHTHLELSALRGKVPGGAGFVSWVERMITVRADILPEEDLDSVERAVGELDAFGTVAVGDVTNSLAAARALSRKGIGGWLFNEVFGIDRAGVMGRLEKLEAYETEDLRYAPAAHTLYTTHEDAVVEVLRRVREKGLRTTLHLAEHAAERRALEAGDGPVAEWYERRLGISRDKVAWPKLSPIAYAQKLGALAPDVIAVHIADAREPELEGVARSGAPVALCPRSNLFIETRLPPLLAMRKAGIAPALGTDSLASNASLDVLAEARALADRFPAVPAHELVTMATWNGARALGRDDLGRIVKGARPGIVAIDADPGDDAAAALIRNVKLPRRFVARRSA
jgi:cytosine/adenosine deaminase-related metal-dependent hydrolase